jgi:hypothetical protein
MVWKISRGNVLKLDSLVLLMNWTIAIPYLMIDDDFGSLETATGKCFVNLEIYMFVFECMVGESLIVNAPQSYSNS